MKTTGAAMESNLRGEDMIEILGQFEPLLDAEEAARHLRIHPKTLMRMARNGVVPACRIGKYWRFRASTLDAWIGTSENRSSQPFRAK
jgi:excisionase family DNA binding protein